MEKLCWHKIGPNRLIMEGLRMFKTMGTWLEGNCASSARDIGASTYSTQEESMIKIN